MLSVLVHAAIICSLSWTTPVPPEVSEPTIKAVLIRLPPAPPETAPVEPEPVLPDVEPKNEVPVTTTEVAPEPVAPAEPTPAPNVSEPPVEPDTQPDAQPPAEQQRYTLAYSGMDPAQWRVDVFERGSCAGVP